MERIERHTNSNRKVIKHSSERDISKQRSEKQGMQTSGRSAFQALGSARAKVLR